MESIWAEFISDHGHVMGLVVLQVEGRIGGVGVEDGDTARHGGGEFGMG